MYEGEPLTLKTRNGIKMGSIGAKGSSGDNIDRSNFLTQAKHKGHQLRARGGDVRMERAELPALRISVVRIP